jgi:hypothetical protein
MDLVDAYVLGELTGADLERFKTHYLASPLRREKVEFAKVFQSLGEPELADPLAGTAAAPSRRGRFAALGGFIKPPPILQWGLAAAALAMLIVGGWLAVENIRLRQQMSQTATRRDLLMQREQDLQKELENQRVLNSQTEQELARVRDERERLEQELKQEQAGAKPLSEGTIVSLLLTPPLRGAAQLPTLSLRPQTNEVAAQLQLEAADYPVYRVALIDPANNQTLWRSGNLRPRIQSTRKAIAVSFRAGLLKPQNYVLQVSGIPAGGGAEIVGDYPFRVVK